jgi:hypothetical protein
MSPVWNEAERCCDTAGRGSLVKRGHHSFQQRPFLMTISHASTLGKTIDLHDAS